MIPLRGAVGLSIICVLIGLTIYSFAVYEARSPSVPPFHFLVTGDDGGFYSYNGSALERIAVPTSSDLTALAWRHDHAYALVVGRNGTILKYDGQSVSVIPSGLPYVSFYGVSWKADDSEALIVGTKGTVLAYDGSVATSIKSGLNETIYAVSWNPKQDLALLVGCSYSKASCDNNSSTIDGLIMEYDGHAFTMINATRVFTHKDPFILYTVAWSPTGNYALIAGSWATLYKYSQGVITQIDMLQLFGNIAGDAHWIRVVKFNDFDGTALILGDHGATILYDRGALTRTRTYTTLSGTEDDLLKGITDEQCIVHSWNDLHCVGHFLGVEWIPGTKIAIAVGPTLHPIPAGFVARIWDMKVTLLIQGGVSSLTSVSNS